MNRGKTKVKLWGTDGNAFTILAACNRAARKAGWTQEQINMFQNEAMSDDYHHLLATVAYYFDVI